MHTSTGVPLKIIDHCPLTFIFKHPTKSTKVSRWSHETASYDLKIIYKPGAAYHVPDLLSQAMATIDLSLIDPEQFRARRPITS